jgi:hypothetical protein
MRRYILLLLLVPLCAVFIYSQEEQNTQTNSPFSKNYIIQISVGSGYSSYFPFIETAVDTMNSESLFRIPLSLDFLFAKKMSNTTAWTVSLNNGLDFFTSSPDSFQVYTILLSGGFQYYPSLDGLSLGIDAGISMLIPITNLSYSAGIEIGSGVSLNINYSLYSLKFSKAGLIPGLGLKLIHLEMLHGAVNQIYGYMSLRLR